MKASKAAKATEGSSEQQHNTKKMQRVGRAKHSKHSVRAMLGRAQRTRGALGKVTGTTLEERSELLRRPRGTPRKRRSKESMVPGARAPETNVVLCLRP